MISEPELIFPALWALIDHPDGLTTTDLIAILREELPPTGKDAELITGRKDDHFSQKVRNLTGSHDTIVKLGLARLDGKKYFITQKGITYLKENEEVCSSLEAQGFSEKQIKIEALTNFENVVDEIREGRVENKSSKRRQRSQVLRDAAVQKFQKPDGTIECAACGFEYSSKYGPRGKGYIEIHHTEMVHKMDEAGNTCSLSEALKKVVPLCSDCHSIVHREKKHPLTLAELKTLIGP